MAQIELPLTGEERGAHQRAQRTRARHGVSTSEQFSRESKILCLGLPTRRLESWWQVIFMPQSFNRPQANGSAQQEPLLRNRYLWDLTRWYHIHGATCGSGKYLYKHVDRRQSKWQMAGEQLLGINNNNKFDYNGVCISYKECWRKYYRLRGQTARQLQGPKSADSPNRHSATLGFFLVAMHISEMSCARNSDSVRFGHAP